VSRKYNNGTIVIVSIDLVLGWQMNEDNHPIEWLPEKGKDLPRLEEGLFSVRARAFEYHSILFAQSGSGKSFLVGRLIEELGIKTQARVVVIDPNSDYIHLDDVNPSIYSNAHYDVVRGIGILPTERDATEFTKLWNSIPKAHVSESLRIPIAALDSRLFLDPSNDRRAAEITYGHSLIVELSKYMCRNWAANSSMLRPSIEDLLTKVRDFSLSVESNSAQFRNENQLYMNFWQGKLRSEDVTLEAFAELRDQNQTSLDDIEYLRQLTGTTAINNLAYAIRRSRDKLLLTEEDQNLFHDPSIYVVDKPSLKDLQYTAIQYVLNQLWSLHEGMYASGYIPHPTILVIDEAHNLTPRDLEPGSPLVSIRENIRRVAAEGRKYGLFLFLISQRPDKLDPLVASECQNKIVMRVGSPRALEAAAPTLGLTPRQLEQLEDAARFKMGRAFVVGPISDESSPAPQAGSGISKFYAAARRTMEGSTKVSKAWQSRRISELLAGEGEE